MDRFAKAEAYFRKHFTPLSLTHDLLHSERVVAGSALFAEILGVPHEERKLIEAAAYFHDFSRPVDSAVDHAAASAEKAGQLFPSFGFSREETDKACEIIGKHSFAGGSYRTYIPMSRAAECVFLADKLLECSGHYIAFRRAVYIGESREMPLPEQAFGEMKRHYRKKLDQLENYRFTDEVRGIKERKIAAERSFVEALESGEVWAKEIAFAGYRAGQGHNTSPDAFIKDFVSSGAMQMLYKKNASEYIKGNLLI
jgi:HD superfamily phosphodiesterase